MSPAPRFFRDGAAFRIWLAANHESASEVVVGYYKVSTGKPSMTWSESVDEALCYGWIDGVRHSLDDARYTIRFTPRKARSVWSKVNVAKVEALIRDGRMTPAGLAAYALRDPARTAIYSFERETAELDAAMLRRFQRNKRAWAYFQAQPPGYRKIVTHYVISAKKPETRAKRLETVIAYSSRGERLPMLTSPRNAPKS